MGYEKEVRLEQITTTINIRIKGEIGYIFSLIEHQLLKIIILSNEYKNERYNLRKNIMLKECSYSTKVDMAFSAIKTHNEELYEKIIDLHTHLKNSSVYRNLMIHGEYLWDMKDLRSFNVWDIEVSKEDKTKQEHILVNIELIEVSKYNTSLMDAYNAISAIVPFFEKL